MVYSVLDYNSFIKEHLHSYKYEFATYYYKIFGEIMLYEIKRKNLYNDIDYIIPVPLDKSKRAFRGYNQSELLGEYIGGKLGIKLLNDVLIKTKKTKDQHNLSEHERKKNLSNVFKLKNNEMIYDKNILILDDILTTGTTLKNCGKLIREGGAKSVYGLTLATGK